MSVNQIMGEDQATNHIHAEQAPVGRLLHSLFALLDDHEVTYCVLRGYEGLPDVVSHDVDMAVWLPPARQQSLPRLSHADLRAAAKAQADERPPEAAGLEGATAAEEDLEEMVSRQGASAFVKTKKLAIECLEDGPGGWAYATTEQRGLTFRMEAGGSSLALLYPSLRGSPIPRCRSIAGGRGLLLEGDFGKDYVFCAAESFTAAVDGFTFSGTVGVAQVRGDGVSLTLPVPGKLSYHGKEISEPGSQKIDL